ncbi:MAG: PD-(D/E)XK nuclease family protein, partial [Lachnospiraceae bacterium]|nr:PD-(D/E)XK nuclease family protein [Lachnospiraceae bacterium]
QNGRHNYFMVGDVKQSIYRFRQARPDIFIRKYREGQKEDPDSVCIDLDRNFRSRPEVTESVNAVFTRIMHREMGGVEYDASQSLKCGRRFEEAGEADFKTELLLSDASQQQSGGFESRTAYEAAIVAARIKALIEKGYCTDKEDGTLRRVRYSDIAILHRSANSVAGVFQDTLKEYGIPSHIVSVTGYFSSICVEVLLSILKIINNPRQDVALAAVLKSPLFAFSDEKLVQIRLNAAERREPFYKALWQYGQEDLRTKEFLETLGRWRKLADRVPLYELLRTVLHETDYLAYVSALPGGDARARNIEKLLSLSIQFENTSYKGLFYFVRYIERMQRYEQDFGQAKAGSDGEAVSIMTIHKSKGLEFPIVFLSGTTKKLGGRPERILVHPDLGVGMHNIDPEKRTRRSTVYRALLSHLNEQEDLGEEQRVLYVAMTRAKDKLIVTGVADKLEEKLEGCAGGTFSRLQIQKARTYLDWILPVAAARADLFEIKTMELGDLVLAETAEQMVGDARLSHLRQKVEQCPPEQIMNLKEELDFHYPHPVHDERKAKYSVSEIKHRSMEALAQESEEAEDVFDIRERKSYIPRFVSGEDPVYAGAQRGTAVHRYLECFDFAREEYVTSYEAQKAEMLSDGRLKEEDAKLLQGDKLQLFLRSDLAARMHRAAAAGYLKKEAAFVMMDSYEHFFEDADAVRESEDLEDPVLVQGIIDAFFEEEDGLVLIDYKTDRIRRESDLSDRYRKQMELYADALSRTHGKKVKEIYLYSFALGCAIMVS